MFKLSMHFIELHEFWLSPFSEDFSAIIVFFCHIFKSSFYKAACFADIMSCS